jgi:transcription initiation factor TFIIIB Brf1 subunit/transcription initiation factor TFIIB
MLGQLLGVPTHVMSTAGDLLVRFIRTPSKWYGTPHSTMCAACIVAACEHHDPSATNTYVNRVSQLNGVDTMSLVKLSNLVLQSN